MSRPKADFENTATYEVYTAYKGYVIAGEPERNEEFAQQLGGGRPNAHAFWNKVLVPQLGYQMPWGSFQYHWQQLQIRKNPSTRLPYIVISDTGAVIVPEIDMHLIPALRKVGHEDLP